MLQWETFQIPILMTNSSCWVIPNDIWSSKGWLVLIRRGTNALGTGVGLFSVLTEPFSIRFKPSFTVMRKMMMEMMMKVRRRGRRTQSCNVIDFDVNNIIVCYLMGIWLIWLWCWRMWPNDDSKELFTCVWWFDFNCQSAEGFYALNEVVISTIRENISDKKVT